MGDLAKLPVEVLKWLWERTGAIWIALGCALLAKHFLPRADALTLIFVGVGALAACRILGHWGQMVANAWQKGGVSLERTNILRAFQAEELAVILLLVVAARTNEHSVPLPADHPAAMSLAIQGHLYRGTVYTSGLASWWLASEWMTEPEYLPVLTELGNLPEIQQACRVLSDQQKRVGPGFW